MGEFPYKFPDEDEHPEVSIKHGLPPTGNIYEAYIKSQEEQERRLQRLYNVRFKDAFAETFPYLDFDWAKYGDEDWGRPIKLWISSTFLQKDEEGRYYVQFPLKNARIFKTEKGTLVMRRNEGTMVYYVRVPGGFRGGADFEVLSPHFEVLKFKNFRSPKGAIGYDMGGLVVTPIGEIKYKWIRGGRLHGLPPEGVTIITPEGKKIQEVV